jgi:hypothetical protein
MNGSVSEGRRNFLKTSAATTAGLALIGPGMRKAEAAPIPTRLVDLSKTPVNTEVDNLRVAYISDPGMRRGTTYVDFPSFNNVNGTTNCVVYPTVNANVDKLACALANKNNVAQAWSTLLKIPNGKSWATGKAAIKVNGIGTLHACVPIVSRVCEVLTGFGMPAANITFMEMGPYGVFMGAGKPIPAGVKTNDTRTNILSFPDGATSTTANALADADIVINIAACKGHDRFEQYSGVTMTLKNHFWSISCVHESGLPQLIRNSRCDHLMGNIPAAYPAKQQLCIVDCLWLGNNNSWEGATQDANHADTIVMGTFSGAVDYVSTMKFRALKFHAGTDVNTGWNQPLVDMFVTGFGYPASALSTVMTPVAVGTSGPGLVDASAVSAHIPYKSENSGLSRQAIIEVNGNGVRPMRATLDLSQGETIRSAAVYDLQGTKIRTLDLSSGSQHLSWNGFTDGGAFDRAGRYVVKVKGDYGVAAVEIALLR